MPTSTTVVDRQALNVSQQRPLNSNLVDGLELGPLLGRGSFGSVFRGRYKGQRVAIKVTYSPFPGHDLEFSLKPSELRQLVTSSCSAAAALARCSGAATKGQRIPIEVTACTLASTGSCSPCRPCPIR